MRFLCLHGRGTNAKTFEVQTESLRQELTDHDFVFINGDISVAPDSVAVNVNGGSANLESAGGYAFLADPVDVQQYQHLLDDLIEMVQSQEPFDALMGFSEGGILAATILLEDSRRPFANFKCALLFSAAPPLNPDALREGQFRCLDPANNATVPIRVPTVHVYSEVDDAVRTVVPNLASPLDSLWAEHGWTTPQDVHGSLASLCELPQVFVHECGHKIPESCDPQALRGMSRVVERTIGSLAG